MITGFRAGPLLIETRIAYTPGVGANNDIQNSGGGVDRSPDPSVDSADRLTGGLGPFDDRSQPAAFAFAGGGQHGEGAKR